MLIVKLEAAPKPDCVPAQLEPILFQTLQGGGVVGAPKCLESSHTSLCP